MNSTRSVGPVDLIDVGQLRQLQHEDSNLRILDVRTGSEFEAVHIEGSYNVPIDRLGEYVRDLANVEHRVVLVCQSGGRATQAHDKLMAAGKDALHILEGGIAAWQAAGGDVIKGETDRWAMDRQVRLVAGAFTLTGIAASVVFPGAKWIAGGVGAGLTFSALSNTCAMATVLAKLPYNQSDKCDVQGVLSELNRPADRPAI